MGLGKGKRDQRARRPRKRTCADCRFMTERTGFLTTHMECLESSAHGRRVREGDPACPNFQPKMVKPGLSLVRDLTAPTRRAARELTRTGEKDARPAAAPAPEAQHAAPVADASNAASDDPELAALEARAKAAEARAQAAEAEAALAEARARAARRQGGAES
ncbi:MAG: hypothetical protein ACI38Z_08905 [Parafannyhessea sp.]|uniref:hypothetical protein n=1 Tax=Parafannyhessea sp. TaxID=2847324 RepID=UPI003F0E00BB